MELFERAKTVRLRSHHDKYLYADEDETHVNQDRNASSPNARWLVEPVPHSPGVLRLRSRYGRYLAASNEPFLLGVTGRKVLQTFPHRLDSSVEWVPVREGGAHAHAVRLRTRYGNFLRANAGLPPWRNSVTHDVPHRHAGWVLWDVEIVQVLPPPGPDSAASDAAAASVSPPPSYKPPSRSPSPSPSPLPTSALRPPPPPHHRPENSAPFRAQPPPPPPGYIGPPAPGLARLESTDSFSVPLHKVEGRLIHYHIGDDNGNVSDDEGHSFTFNGTSLGELLERLKEETGLEDVIICSRSPINGKLIPLRLQLPPDNVAMHIVLVQESSKVAKTFL
ncbi:uncharacterized protein LOC133891118 [Phragmites australis]|uniref:uncharacterized protein LOC133891118 n=1 Tax=Phragmites australis TaxID=29695 RepID=UPI002D766FD6|nr:uncharacterized protein LOC133891118 [Phragmites australis]